MSKPVHVLLMAKTSWKGVCLIVGFLWESFSYNAGRPLSFKVNNYIILYRESQEKETVRKYQLLQLSLSLSF